MSFISDLADRILNPILEKLKTALGPFGKLFDLTGKFFTGLKTSYTKGFDLVGAVKSEVDAWRNFAVSIPIKTGVINIPKAVEQTKELLQQIRAAWDAVVDLAEQIKNQLRGQQGDPTEEAAAAARDIEESGVKNLLERLPRLAKGLEKILGFLAIAVGTLESIQAGIDDLTEILDAIRGIREEIESGSTVFLQQKNPRKREHLSDGSPISLRIGSLHS